MLLHFRKIVFLFTIYCHIQFVTLKKNLFNSKIESVHFVSYINRQYFFNVGNVATTKKLNGKNYILYVYIHMYI